MLYITQEHCLCKVSKIQVALQKVDARFISHNYYFSGVKSDSSSTFAGLQGTILKMRAISNALLHDTLVAKINYVFPFCR